MPPKTPANGSMVADPGAARARAYADHRGNLPGAGTPGLDRLRDAAMDAFARTGLPNRRMEAWKYVDLRGLVETDWRLATSADHVGRADLPEPLAADGRRVVLVDGRYRPDLSDAPQSADGVTVTALGDALRAGDASAERAMGEGDWHRAGPMIALNTAMAADGVVITIADGMRVVSPVEIVHWTTDRAEPVEFHARHALLLGSGAGLTVIERFAGASTLPVLANHGCHVALAPGASIDHIRVQTEPAATLHLAAYRIALTQGAAYRGRQFAIGAAASRVDMDVSLAGENAEFDLSAAYLARANQQSDLTTRVRHQVPNTRGAQLVKGVVSGRARGVFQGEILVEQGAQGTDARQYSRAMLLSPHAEVDTKPELRIFADDVQCAHGAAIGDLDPDQMFYMRARGIDEAAARAMLVEAFIAEIIDNIPSAAVRVLLSDLTATWLAGESAA